MESRIVEQIFSCASTLKLFFLRYNICGSMFPPLKIFIFSKRFAALQL